MHASTLSGTSEDSISSVTPPTAHLPPMKKIPHYPPEHLLKFLVYLRSIYSPPVRGSKRRRHSETAVALENWRSDSFERSYAIRWLTVLVSHAGLWEEEIQHHALIAEAAALLAVCSGTAGAGVIHRDFVFSPGAIRVQLTDVPLENHDFGSVGAQTWGGACVLAEAIVEDPTAFGLQSGIRVLELGAGTGLVSIVVGKLLEGCVTIVATDFYPSVLDNLKANIGNNFVQPASVAISSTFLDWADSDNHDVSLDAPFDVVLGADIVYDAQHAVWIKKCLRKFLSKGAVFHLVIPLRATFATESNTVELIFQNDDLVVLSKEPIVCDAENGIGDEVVEYAYYKIGWAS
ncbi:putative methyltransferase-domain-containing protein [Desarmillaria tabescens]|uniref:Methyltransferase-domain-containing protein n=1 Tax=Armillaria tabescens TaxID=1929756 RepID=A0AA39MWB6_ARMTA|nr:putative methyltransferase-domain-containing protein [Desarmillaria tabescens]KAK0448459.1 putative methyltransferase-domain-containing protein [Desarmillaria tabescens]